MSCWSWCRKKICRAEKCENVSHFLLLCPYYLVHTPYLFSIPWNVHILHMNIPMEYVHLLLLWMIFRFIFTWCWLIFRGHCNNTKISIFTYLFMRFKFVFCSKWMKTIEIIKITIMFWHYSCKIVPFFSISK